MKRRLFLALSTVWIGLFWIHTPANSQEQDPILNMAPDSVFAAIDVRPKSAMTQPSMAIIPHEIIKVFGERELGIDLLDMTRATIFVDPIGSDMSQPPEFGAVIEFGSDQQLSEKITSAMKPTELDGVKGFTDPGDDLFLMIQKRKFIMGTKKFVSRMMKGGSGSSELITRMKARQPSDHANAAVMLDPIREMIKSQLPPKEQIPPTFRKYLQIPDLIDAVSLRMDFSAEQLTELTLTAVDEKSAQRLEKMIDQGIDQAKSAVLSAAAMQAEIPAEYQDALIAYADRVSNLVRQAAKPKMDGKNLTYDLGNGNNGSASSVAVVGIMVGMLLPAVQQVREAARRTQSMNNLRQLVLAMHNYADANGHLPMQASYSEDGKPLLSWRVHLLPYLGQGELYKQFHLDEPWNSEHNLKLLEKMPPTYMNPNLVESTRTNYLAIAGARTGFPGNKKLNFQDFVDGTSNTVAFVEADASMAVEWTRPVDLKVDLERPLFGLGGMRPGVFIGAMFDGSVQSFKSGIDAKIWKEMLIINDTKR